MSDTVQYPQFSAAGVPITYVPNPFSADGKPADSQWKNPVRVHSTGTITLFGLQTVDGVGLMEGDRVLVKDQSNDTQNGIYTASAGTWRRSNDAYMWSQLVAAVVAVKEGSTATGTVWQCVASGDGTLGVSHVHWVPVSSSTGSLGAFTPLRSIISDAVGNPMASPTTSQEIAYLSGVTSPVKTQFSSLTNLASAAFSIAVDGTNAAEAASLVATNADVVAHSGSNVALAAYSMAQIGTAVGLLAYNYAVALGDKYVRTTRFAAIGSGTSGTVTLPSSAVPVLNDFGGTTDAVITAIGGGRPTFNHVFTAAGAVVTTDFDASGAYALSGIPSSYPVALVYRVRQPLSTLDNTATDIIGDYDVEDLSSLTGTENQVYVNGTTGLPQYGDVVLSLPQPVGTNSSVRFANVNASGSVQALAGIFDYIDPVNYIDFNIVNAGTLSRNTGRLHWDMTDLTLSVDMYGSNVTLQIGEEILIYARNNSGVPITNGSAVYISGATGQRPTIALASAAVRIQARGAVGLATEDIDTNAFGYVCTQGLVRDFDTNSFAEGRALFLGVTPGSLTMTPPTQPNATVFIGVVVKKAGVGSGCVYVDVKSVDALNELQDVYIPTRQVGDHIVYNGSLWVNEAGTASTAYQYAAAAYALAQTGTLAVTTITAGTTSAAASRAQQVYLANSSSGSVVVALPNTLGLSGALVTVKKTSAESPQKAVVVRSSTGTQTIDGATDQTIYAQYTAMQVTTDGANWFII